MTKGQWWSGAGVLVSSHDQRGECSPLSDTLSSPGGSGAWSHFRWVTTQVKQHSILQNSLSSLPPPPGQGQAGWLALPATCCSLRGAVPLRQVLVSLRGKHLLGACSRRGNLVGPDLGMRFLPGGCAQCPRALSLPEAALGALRRGLAGRDSA